MSRSGRPNLITPFLALLLGLSILLLTMARLRYGRSLDWPWETVPICIATGLVAVSWWRHRFFTTWSLPALGYLIGVGLPSLAGLLPANASDAAGYLWPLVSAAVAAFLLWRLGRRPPLPRRLWLLLAMALLVQPASLFLGGSLLLPAALALHLARRHGSRAVLVSLAALYWPVAELFDPAYAILIWSDNRTVYSILTLLPVLIFLLIAPAGLLAARTRNQEAVAAVTPVAAGLLAGEVARSAVFAATARGGYDSALWLIRGGFIIQTVLLLSWVLLCCRWTGPQKPAARLETSASAAHPSPQT